MPLFPSKYKKISKYLLVLAFFLIGTQRLALFHYEISSNNKILEFANKKMHTVDGVIASPIEYSQKGGKFIIDVKRIISGEKEVTLSGKLLVYAKKIDEFSYGDFISFRTKIRKPKNFNNPGSFDYVKYLQARGIVATCSLNNMNKLLIIKKGHKKGPIYYVQQLRENVSRFIRANGVSQNKQIVSSLLFGGTKNINRYAHDLFIKTSTAHILAISGLHMGVISLFFYYIALFIFTRSEKLMLEYNVIKMSYSVALIFLIFYSLIVGMRVSSIRAVIMIGIYILSVLLGKAQNTLRTMVIAAFIILLVYPASISDVSFLLSFSAVFAILYFYPKLNLRFDKYIEATSDNYFKKSGLRFSILKSSLMVFTLSLVINIVITPIMLYYFNHISLSAPLINEKYDECRDDHSPKGVLRFTKEYGEYVYTDHDDRSYG
ncbi:ComEC/Rec2 family competence protein [Thermodesulfobacteriota bacterium]